MSRTSSSSSSRTPTRSQPRSPTGSQKLHGAADTSRSQAAGHRGSRTRRRRSASPTGATSSSGGATSAACRQTTSCRTTRSRNARCSTTSARRRVTFTGSRASSARSARQPTTSASSATRCSTSRCSASGPTATSRHCSRMRRHCRRRRRVLPAEPGLDPFVDRVTLSIPALTSARVIVFALGGAEKADAARRAFAERPSPETPASLVRATNGRTTAILDRAAAAKLPA